MPERPLPPEAPHAGNSAGERLKAHKEWILSLWVDRLRRQVPAADAAPQPILINTVPAVLDQLAEALSADHPRETATQGSTVAQEHGGERVRLTQFALADLVVEYKILRHAIFEVIEEDEPLTARERHTLDASIDQAIIEAYTGYVLVQSAFKDQFFATLAHDLRTPLNAARSGAHLILSSPEASDVPTWAGRIDRNLARIDRMLQDLLDTMRVQTGARQPARRGHHLHHRRPRRRAPVPGPPRHARAVSTSAGLLFIASSGIGARHVSGIT